MQTQRIGVLTSEGDCPGLNAVLRGVFGFEDGFESLLPPPSISPSIIRNSARSHRQGGGRLRFTDPDNEMMETPGPKQGLQQGKTIIRP